MRATALGSVIIPALLGIALYGPGVLLCAALLIGLCGNATTAPDRRPQKGHPSPAGNPVCRLSVGNHIFMTRNNLQSATLRAFIFREGSRNANRRHWFWVCRTGRRRLFRRARAQSRLC